MHSISFGKADTDTVVSAFPRADEKMMLAGEGSKGGRSPVELTGSVLTKRNSRVCTRFILDLSWTKSNEEGGEVNDEIGKRERDQGIGTKEETERGRVENYRDFRLTGSQGTRKVFFQFGRTDTRLLSLL
jgi:hypothetical protein